MEGRHRDEFFGRYLQTYPAARTGEIRDAVFPLCDLMDEAETDVSLRLGFTADREEAAAARGYLEHVRALPRDAAETC